MNRSVFHRPHNRIKELLEGGGVPIGIEFMTGSERLLEMIGWAGFDYVHLDMEHTAFGFEAIESQVRIAQGVGLTPIVRVTDMNPHSISRVLETGAQGIVIPQVRGVDDVRAVLEAMRYAPEGTRGMCPVTRTARYSDETWDDYLEWANKEVMLIPLIENEAALDALEDICAIPEVRVVGLGSGDLGQSLGFGAEGMSAPVVQEAFERTVEVARRTNTAVEGMPVISADRQRSIRDLVESGVGMITYDADALMFMRLCRDIVEDWHEAIGRDGGQPTRAGA